MSDNENVIHIFVKGYLGRGAYIVANVKGEELHNDIFDGLSDAHGKTMHQFYTDQEMIIKSLEYVKDNRGNKNIPKEPVIFIFTTYENTFEVTVEKKNTEKSKYKNNIDKIEELKKSLKRNIPQKTDDNVKIFYVPEKFKNKMDDVVDLLKKQRTTKRPGH